jgi:transcriptional regulator with XRE-family HTH domain
MSAITDVLRSARLAAGLSQREVAAALGITPQYLADLERGRRELPIARYGALPEPIRNAVVGETIKHHKAIIAALKAIR